MRKKPYMQSELFYAICDILKEKGMMPYILDYHLAEKYHDKPIEYYEFDFSNSLEYGGCEGIYLNIYIEGRDFRNNIGTFKTLGTSREDMHTMAILLADFVVEGKAFVEKNLDDFTWQGYEVGYVEDGFNIHWAWEVPTEERAMVIKEQMLSSHDKIVIRDNATRKERTYTK